LQPISGHAVHTELVLDALRGDVHLIKQLSLGPTVPNEHHADGKGVRLLRTMCRLDLTADMRASEDPTHVQFIREMRDVNSPQPVSDGLLRTLNLFTKNTVEAHGDALRFLLAV
jgi:hypothetical protein